MYIIIFVGNFILIDPSVIIYEIKFVGNYIRIKLVSNYIHVKLVGNYVK